MSDENLKALTKDILDQPAIVSGWEKSYDDAVIKEQEILEEDTRNKGVQDNLLASINAYHTELQGLNNSTRTLYNEADLITSSVNLAADTPHFPNPPTYPTYWVKVQPYVIASNNGNPVSTANTTTENLTIEGLLFYTDTIQNGFNIGSNVSTSSGNIFDNRYEAPFSGFTSGFAAGQVIILRSGLFQSLVKITSVQVGNVAIVSPATPATPDIINWTYISGTLPSLLTGTVSLLRNALGYTESERSGTTTPIDITILDLFKTEIDDAVTGYGLSLEALKIDLAANPSPPPFRGQNEEQIVQIDQLLSDLLIWENQPFVNPTGSCRFDNSGLNLLDALLLLRSANGREAEVIASLGNVSQGADGAFTGSGLYFNLFIQIDKRINIAEGSLPFYLSFPATQLKYQQNQALAQSILDNYNAAYVVIQFSEDYDYDADSPSNVVKLLEVNGLSDNDQVKIMDNDSSVFDRTITFVNTATNEIFLDSPLTESLNTAGKLARVYKEL
jgi:hypothetical protein